MMKSLAIATMLACIAVLNAQPIKDEEVADHPSDYLFIRRAMTWTQADSECRRHNMRLVTVRDWYQNQYIFTELKRRRMGSSWTGLSDRAREGSFTWLYANSCHRWTNWHRGEPNGHRNENCVELIPGWGGKWNDVSCNQRRTAVCHRVEGCGYTAYHHAPVHQEVHYEKVYYRVPADEEADDEEN